MVNPDSQYVNRRNVLRAVVAGIAGAMGAVIGALVGGAVVSPGLSARRQSWIDAGQLDGLPEARPTEVSLGFEREDGYRVTREHRVVYLVRQGEQVRALSAVCTHLGCRVAWHDGERAFKCPCHGGRFTPEGQVAGGPPPRALDELPTRVEGSRVFVELG